MVRGRSGETARRRGGKAEWRRHNRLRSGSVGDGRRLARRNGRSRIQVCRARPDLPQVHLRCLRGARCSAVLAEGAQRPPSTATSISPRTSSGFRPEARWDRLKAQAQQPARLWMKPWRRSSATTRPSRMCCPRTMPAPPLKYEICRSLIHGFDHGPTDGRHVGGPRLPAAGRRRSTSSHRRTARTAACRRRGNSPRLLRSQCRTRTPFVSVDDVGVVPDRQVGAGQARRRGGPHWGRTRPRHAPDRLAGGGNLTV